MASLDADVVSTVQRQVAEALDRQRLLETRPWLVVAVSGGADSLCLLDALVAVVPQPTRRLFVGHVDHQLRSSSEADAEHVKRIAASLGLSGTVDTVNVPALAKAKRLGTEEAARLGRYRSLRLIADCLGTDIVLTGHTRDDSVETIILNLLRGTGARGLSGISEVESFSTSSFGQSVDVPAASLRLVRPLLQVGRAETVTYCEMRGIHWVTDASNADPAFTRNRVRAHLMPVLRTYNPSVDRALVRMAQGMGVEDAWLDDLARRRWARIRHDSGVDFVLNLAGWRRLPLPLQRRIVRLIASSLGHNEIGFEAVERALAVGSPVGPPRAELGGGLSVKRRADTLAFDFSARVHDE